MNDLEFRHSLKIDVTILDVWVEQGWLVPDRTDRGLDFRDADVARGRLILDLIETMGVNEAGVDVVMDLVDQVHGLRGTLRDLMEAVRVQDHEIQQRIRSDIDRVERGDRS
jgi:chaperone modulatory protein CbpM